MQSLKTVSQVRQAYACARRRFQKERRWIERGGRTTDRAREVRRVAIAWAQLMIPATLRQRCLLNGSSTTCKRQDGGFSVELRTDSRLIPERVEFRPLTVRDAKDARRDTCTDAHTQAPLEYDIQIFERICRPWKDWSCDLWQLLHSAYIECLSTPSEPPRHACRAAQFFDYALVAILSEPERVGYFWESLRNPVREKADETVRALARRLGRESNHAEQIRRAEMQLYQGDGYEYNKAALENCCLGALPPRRYIRLPLPSGKRSIQSLDDEHVFRLDILCDAAERARGKSKGGPQRKVLRDWYILRTVAGLGAIGYRAAAACELVLEEVTGYKAATLYKILDHRRARDDAAEHACMLEIEELREYKARSKAAIKEILGECIAYRYRDEIREEVQDIWPTLHSRIREAEANLRAIRERRYTYHSAPRIPPTVPSP